MQAGSRSVRARPRPCGVHGVTSDAHRSLVDTSWRPLPVPPWQGYRTHLRNLLTLVPQVRPPFVATLLRLNFARPDADAVPCPVRTGLRPARRLLPR
jgi:transposase-like protein